jgi:hypothetical protein
MNNKIKKTGLLFGDIAVLYLSLYATLWIRYLGIPNKTLWERHFASFTAIFGVWIYFTFPNYTSPAVHPAPVFPAPFLFLLVAGLLAQPPT